MNDDRSVERAAREWIDSGPTQAPDRPVEAALLRIQTTRQERDLGIPWRFPTMNPIMRLAAVAVVGAVALGGALFILKAPGPSVGAPSASPGASPTIEGTWETTFTHAQMQLAGLADAGEDDAANYGHFILSIHGGHVATVQLTDPKSSSVGTYVVNGNTFTATTNGETFSWPFSVTADTLTFGPGGPVTLRVKPWTRIGP
jgi:hypothetical protein